jgi:hypothetical protein
MHDFSPVSRQSRYQKTEVIMQKSLNELYSRYLTGDFEREELEGAVFLWLFNNPEKTWLRHWKSDEYEDFISWFYPRLKGSIDSYKDTGSSFEAYMSKFLLVASKEYNVRKTTNAVTEYSAWAARVPELYAMEEPPVYKHRNEEDFIAQMVIDKNGRKNSRRILALILKCYYYVSEDFAEKIAPLIEIDAKTLLEMLSKIREIRQKRDDEIYLMKERIYCQYYRCMIYEKKISIVEEDSVVHKKLTLRLVKARQRLEKMRKRMTAIRTEATNKQVAEVIGVAKGTVDSSLHRLKEKWKNMAKKAELN